MPKTLLIALLSLILGLSSACKFVISTYSETDKANTLVREGNALQLDGIRIQEEAADRYEQIVKVRPRFEDRTRLERPLEVVVFQLETARGKLALSAEKSVEASKLYVPEYFKEYLSLRAGLLSREADVADIVVRQVKLNYDLSLASAEDFDERWGALDAESASIREQQTEIAAQVNKIRSEHEESFISLA